MPYDYAVDMWSIGCTLYELYTGKILFTGDSNNQMLKAIMEIRGKLTPKLFKRGQLAGVHFDDKGQFISVERDKVLNKVCSSFSLRFVPIFQQLSSAVGSHRCMQISPIFAVSAGLNGSAEFSLAFIAGSNSANVVQTNYMVGSDVHRFSHRRSGREWSHGCNAHAGLRFGRIRWQPGWSTL